MDTTIHNQIFRVHNPDSCDVINYNIKHPIKQIMFDNYKYLVELDMNFKARPCVLDNIQRCLLCGTLYLGYDYFECRNCDNFNIIPRHCHSRFCNSCGVKYAKQLAAKATTLCLDTTHRHIVFTIPEELRKWFRQDRSRLSLLFVASRNTISSIVNKSLCEKSKKKKIKLTHYLYKDNAHRKQFGMIATLHTFGRDLKWNPHIHALIAEMIYDPDKDKIKRFNYFDFKKLRKTFQFELIRLMEEAGAFSKKIEKTRLYKNHPEGFYVYAKYDSDNTDDYDEQPKPAKKKDYSKDIEGCINYCMRYASRPAMAESRITKYERNSDTVEWYYHDHKDNKRYDVVDNVHDFINKLIIHIPDKHFKMTRFYGFYSNAAQKTLDRCHELLGKKKKKDYSRYQRMKKRKTKMNSLKFRTHLIDSFNRDPIKCGCGYTMKYRYTYDPLKGKKNDRIYRNTCINEMHQMWLSRKRSRMGT